ncbi:hypothetical protein LJC55_03805, partial [Eubacteriales bacterium OttesenSCG-928-N14]|nr:hypothetical protein [Eubacteriales bacterium OttesenSCG-928-N14]
KAKQAIGEMRGEFVLIVLPQEGSTMQPQQSGGVDGPLLMQQLLEAGLPRKAAAEIVATHTCLSKNEAYQIELP